MRLVRWWTGPYPPEGFGSKVRPGDYWIEGPEGAPTTMRAVWPIGGGLIAKEYDATTEDKEISVQVIETIEMVMSYPEGKERQLAVAMRAMADELDARWNPHGVVGEEQ